MILQLSKVLINSLVGRLGKDTIYMYKRGVLTARQVYTDTQSTPAQQIFRENFNKADQAFVSMSFPERHIWRLAATKRKKYSNYSYFMSHNLKRLAKGLNIQLTPP